MKLIFLVAILALGAFAKESKKEEETTKDITGGFFGDIEWVEFDKAVGVAKDLKKPIFFLIHKTWCGACTRLKEEFKRARHTDDLIELSKKFVMVNVEDDDEPEDDKYAPDGGYIPRILFLDTDAEPLKTNNEAKYRNNKYFYPLVPQIIDGMKRALKDFEEVSGETLVTPEGTAVEEEEEKVVEKKEEKKTEEKKEKKEKKEEKKENKEKKEDKKEKKEKKEDKKKEEKKEKKDDKKKEDKKEKKDDKKKEEKKEKKDDKKKEEKKEKKAEKKDKKSKKDKEEL